MKKIASMLIAIILVLFTFCTIYWNSVHIYFDVLLPLIFAAIFAYLLLVLLLCRKP